MSNLLATFFAVEQEENINLRNMILSLQRNTTDMDFSYIIASKSDKEGIRKEFISLCERNEDNIIILIGNTTVFSMLSDIFNEVIDKNISKQLNKLKLLLTKVLQYSFDRLLCGIRHQTLIITIMCDSYVNISLNLQKHHAFIIDIIHLMAEEHERINDLKHDNSDNSDKSICSHVESKEETKKMSVMTKFYKKPEQNVKMSVKQALEVMNNIIFEDDDYKVNIQTVKTIDAYNRILAKDVFTMAVVPPCRTSAKHGYAMLASDGKNVRKVLKAHLMFPEFLFPIIPGTCKRVRSGDSIPNGADTVVTPENIKILDECSDDDDDYFNIDDKEYEIEVLVAPKINENIRNAGYLVKNEGPILKKFKRIGPSELGILALCDIHTIPVIKILPVGVLSIRSRLEKPGNTSTLGRIYDSNRIILTSLLKKNGYTLTDIGISTCQLDDMIKQIEDALDKVDVLVIMGAVNDKDILKTILTEYFNAVIHFGCLDMKPGKSTTFASCTVNKKLKFFLCMSANPATVPIVAHVVLLPLLNIMHCNCFTPIVMQTCIKNHELHSRPKFSWTTVQWTEEEKFLRAYCSKNRHQNIMKYQNANALLMLPPRTWEVSKIDAAFMSGIFLG